MGVAMVEGLAELAKVDPDARGIGDLGRFEGWAERQVGRWRRQLDGYAELDGYPGPDIPGVEAVGTWLDAHQPARVHKGLIHGDFHFANVLIRPDSGALAAIVDWELSTIGDPLLDLGHLLATWPVRDGGEAPIGVDVPRLLSHRRRHRPLCRPEPTGTSPISPGFACSACYRLGLILEGTHARACAGLAPREVGDQLHLLTVMLFEQALELIG